ncbi:hypothetical protein IT398_01180 [Candidatus Nomurabacteria bacterium]|nr:hypothetical protein [Candidatus Nomurabacteria bacterium]
MARKKLTIIIGAVIVLVLIVVLVTTKNNEKTAEPELDQVTVNDLFPSGEMRPGLLNEQGVSSTTIATNIDNVENLATIDRSGRFFQVTTRPIGGLVRLGTGTSSTVIVVEKATGHLYRVSTNAVSLERISNTTIPKIYRLIGGQTGTSTQIIFQYLKGNRIQTFSGNLELTSATNEDGFLNQSRELEPLSGGFLAQDIEDIVTSPKQNKLFWLETVNKEMLGYLANTNGDKKELIFRSPYPEWRASWATSSVLAIQTRSAQSVDGSLYFIDIETKKWEPIITGVPGLTTLVSPSLKHIIYSGDSDRGLVFGFYDAKKHLFNRLNLQTWADKCVWNQSGIIAYCAAPSTLPPGHQYPDDWYRGEVRLADNIWKLDASNNQTEIIFSPATANLGEKIDANNLLLSPDERILYLTNRNDNNLWALNLETGF